MGIQEKILGRIYPPWTKEKMEIKIATAMRIAREDSRCCVIASYDYGNGDGPRLGIFWESDLDYPEVACFEPVIQVIINEDGTLE